MTEKKNRNKKQSKAKTSSKVSKGNFGYFRSEKRRRLIITAILFAVPLFIFFTSWFYFKTRMTVWTVVTVVGCLPACKSMVNLIMILKCRPMDAGLYQKIHEHQGSMDIPEYLRSLEVPKLFLQPFVENAIVHGFKNYQDSGKIWISAEEEENDILFYVEDNGCGICEEDLKEVLNKERKSIGVRNTNKRIRMIYGEKYGVTISSQLEEGTVVTIRLPLKVNSKKQS